MNREPIDHHAANFATNVTKLTVGSTYRYKELCKLLATRVCNGSSRRAQRKIWDNYFQLETVGYSYTVTAILSTHQLADRPNAGMTLGVGIMDIRHNEASAEYKRIHKTWVGMLQRCYSEEWSRKSPTYKDCTVCPEWLTFSNFRKWMLEQDWEGLELDKDLLVRGNKVYSPETCIFVSRKVNLLAIDRNKLGGKYLTGVGQPNVFGNYPATCSKDGVSHYLGAFRTELEAHEAYKTFKKEVILLEASRQTNDKVRDALIKLSETYFS